MSARKARIFLIVFISAIVLLLGAWLVLLRDVPQERSNDPAWTFNHGSIGNEAAQGLPYWIWRVLPAVVPDLLPGNQRGFSAIGVAWEPGAQLPVGFSQRTVGVIPRVAPNCAFCHQGTYRLDLEDPETIVNAGPGTRVNVQGFLRFLVAAGQDERFKSSLIMEAIKARYDMPLWERLLYRFVLIPGTRAALKKQAAQFKWTDNRPDWGPGRIDPFNPVKFANLKMSDDGTIGNSDIMPLWDLQSAAATEQRRFAVHWDGLSTDVHETVMSGAIGDGLTYRSYPVVARNLAAIEDFVNLVQPPDSPFSSRLDPSSKFYVDAEAVAQGARIYEQDCASCHDVKGERYRMPIPIAELGTDRHRLDMWTREAKERYSDYEDDHDWGLQYFQKTDGYLAVDLKGLWLRGPYLHNGSVPNLRHLLTRPAERPTTFWRGSDLVDAENGGFVSAEGADPYRYTIRVDTTVIGNANTGHVWGTDLDEVQKEALLAYLKTL
ncbi:c-type cytochrome [Granulosicoccus sp. 3-233]|uniref:c-type cytochrome n=1 Tax=Granulosicoccus sp. 3-233 TaxID=3417969 RepID=UPI003D326C78